MDGRRRPTEWVVRSLSSFGVPANAVVEVAVIIDSSGSQKWGGVRAVGSSLDRRFLLHESEGGGRDAVVIHVQANGSSEIEYFADQTSDVYFALLGYWNGGTYVERFDRFSAGSGGSWQDRNLGSYGVGAESGRRDRHCEYNDLQQAHWWHSRERFHCRRSLHRDS